MCKCCCCVLQVLEAFTNVFLSWSTFSLHFWMRTADRGKLSVSVICSLTMHAVPETTRSTDTHLSIITTEGWLIVIYSSSFHHLEVTALCITVAFVLWLSDAISRQPLKCHLFCCCCCSEWVHACAAVLTTTHTHTKKRERKNIESPAHPYTD